MAKAGIEGVAEVPESAVPFWHSQGWQPAPDPLPRPTRREAAMAALTPVGPPKPKPYRIAVEDAEPTEE